MSSSLSKKLMLWSILAFALGTTQVSGQDVIYNPKPYEIKLTLTNGLQINGLLWKVTPDSIFIKSSGQKFWRDPQYPLKINAFSGGQIQEVMIKRNYSVAKNYLTGYYSGVGGGLIVALAQSYPSGFSVIFGGFIGSAVGLLSSGLAGRRLYILGNTDNLKNHFPLLNQHAVLVKISQPMAMQ
jgi:hypothetical protein